MNAAAAVAAHPAGASLRERAFVPSLLFLAGVQSIVSSLGAPVIPRIADEFHASVQSAQWSLTAPLLVSAVASPLIGRLGDGRHRRTAMLACTACVLVGGVVAALATGLEMLVAGRALQGMSLTVMPLSMAAARSHLPPHRAGRAIAAISVGGAVGVGLGFPITGLIVTVFDVKAAFWFGALITGVALTTSWLLVPRPGRDEPGARGIDLRGAVLIAVALLGVLLALEKGPDWGWGSARVLLLGGAGLALLAAWARYELAVDEPLVELRLLRHPPVMVANAMGIVLAVAMYMMPVLVSLFAQQPDYGLGQSAFTTGLMLLPFSAAAVLGSRSLPALERLVGMRAVLPVGSLVIAAAGALFALTTHGVWTGFVTMGLLGLGMGWTFAAMPGLIVPAVPRRETGSALGFYQVTRFIGFSIGSGAAVTLLRAFGDDGVPTLGSFRAAGWAVAGLCALAALLGWAMTRRIRLAPADERAVDEGEVAPAYG